MVATIKELTNLDFSTVIIGIFVILSAIIAVYEIIGKISVIIGKPIKKYRQREEDHKLVMENAKAIKQLTEKHEESVKQSIRHDEIIKTDLLSLTNTVNGIASTLEEMQEKIDRTEMSKLKDKILSYYRKYKDIGEWDQLESDVFWGLYDSYISHGGNSFVKNELEPVMRKLNVKN